MTTPQRVAENVTGDFYVTTACIDCGTCRMLAPDVYTETGKYSAVRHQPQTSDEVQRSVYALLACPTAAIRCDNPDLKATIQNAASDFPLHLEGGVYYNGFTSRHAYGASSYFIQHPDGNWMIDAPRWLPSLVKKYEALGGISTILLTHQDDIGDAERYAAHFGAKRIIHEYEKHAQPDAEHILQGREDIQWHPDFEILFTPGHTKGHVSLLYKNRFLFSGDHLAWDSERDTFKYYKDFCWYSFDVQKESIAKLTQHRFAWLLPGHGGQKLLDEADMHRRLTELVAIMKSNN